MDLQHGPSDLCLRCSGQIRAHPQAELTIIYTAAIRTKRGALAQNTLCPLVAEPNRHGSKYKAKKGGGVATQRL